MKAADKSNSKYTLIVGEDEIKKGMGVLRNMETKKQYNVNLKNAHNEIIRYLKEE